MKLPPQIKRSKLGEKGPLAGARAAQLVPRRAIAGPVSWVIAIMIALTVIAAAGGLALGNLANSARAGLSGAITVQVVEASARIKQAKVEQVIDTLVEDPAVSSLRAVPEEELSDLLEPWLGSIESGDAVPVPALIDVQLGRAADEAEVARLQALLDSNVTGARVDAQSDWLKPVYSALAALQYLALGLIVLLALTSSAAVWLASRSAFASHRETVEIVHLLGGTDEQIARIFQRSVGIDAFLGGAIGLALGALAVWIIGAQFSALDSGMVAGGNLRMFDLVLIAAIPVVGVALAVLTARITVMSALRQML